MISKRNEVGRASTIITPYPLFKNKDFTSHQLFKKKKKITPFNVDRFEIHQKIQILSSLKR